MIVTVLGSGTSHGVPVIGCSCSVCTSKDPKDQRSRTSVLIEVNGRCILIDTATEFRIQAVREGISRIDAVLVTHPHADHIHGLDDIRALTKDTPIPFYSYPECVSEIKARFSYIFMNTQKGGGKPDIRLTPVTTAFSPVQDASVKVIPIPVMHGSLPIFGYRINSFAYLTDCSAIPEESYDLLKGVTHLIIDGLREKFHETHFNFNQAEEAIERINPREAYITHICHSHSHKEIEQRFKGLAAPSFDGQKIEIPSA